MTQDQALTILKTGANVFLTGEPGSGKTYTINKYIGYLRSHEINPAITASTGIAATHIGGVTIHSWSGIGIATFLNKYDVDRISSNKYIIQRLEKAGVLIIDEVSMLAPGTLSMVDMVCQGVKRNQLPFGGLQVIFVGDFFQLPPVQSAFAKNQSYGGSAEALAKAGRVENINAVFAYQSEAWIAANPVTCYLTEQFRQTDLDFNLLLKAIRSGEFDGEYLSHLEKRMINPESKLDGIPKLFSHNADVDRVNLEHLHKLPGETVSFAMTSKGRRNLIEGLQKSCLSPEQLDLKINAAVMFTKNNPKGGYANGTLGTVIGFDKDSGYPIVKTFDNLKITVGPTDWNIMEGDRIMAAISQIPLRLAWAITVHKSQGMTLDAAVMDLRQVFEFGQGYVALSRVRNLSGLHLLGWNDRTFHVHPQILEIDQQFRAGSAEAENVFGKMAPAELMKLHENFIRASGGSVAEVEVEDKNFEYGPKVDTYEQTLVLWNEGKAVDEISEVRELTTETILSHIEKLSAKQKIKQADLDRLVTDSLAELLPSIHDAFKELGVEKLSTVFVKFQGQYSYNDLRIARILYKMS